MRYYFDAFQKYAVFSGRTTRSEYWVFTLWNGIVVALLVLAAADPKFGGNRSNARAVAQGATIAYWWVSLLPSFALASRRLHDTGRSAFWMLVPFLGGLALGVGSTVPKAQVAALAVAAVAFLIGFLFTVQDSQPGPNRFGPDPKHVKSGAVEATQ
jgi:uncharacterized membrane protein YhaH (DUF805 family)